MDTEIFVWVWALQPPADSPLLRLGVILCVIGSKKNSPEHLLFRVAPHLVPQGFAVDNLAACLIMRSD